MLIRQRTILRLVGKAGRPVSSTVLFKLAFLLRQETSVGDDPTFYDFLPYKFGPYSFAMHRELEALVAHGYLKREDGNSSLRFRPGPMAMDFGPPVDAEGAIATILAKYGRIPQRDLLRDVYTRYPWYSINSQLRDLVTTPPSPDRKKSKAAVYTIGYHKASVDSFANRLLQEGIRNIVDVRANPVSRKYGFAGSSLSAICRKVGVGYAHFPRLGIPSARRQGLVGTEAFAELFLYYERHILAENGEDVAAVSTMIKSAPSALLCAEQNASECHRSRLAAAVSESTGLPIIDL